MTIGPAHRRPATLDDLTDAVTRASAAISGFLGGALTFGPLIDAPLSRGTPHTILFTISISLLALLYTVQVDRARREIPPRLEPSPPFDPVLDSACADLLALLDEAERLLRTPGGIDRASLDEFLQRSLDSVNDMLRNEAENYIDVAMSCLTGSDPNVILESLARASIWFRGKVRTVTRDEITTLYAHRVSRR